MEAAQKIALRGLVAVTQVALAEDYTHRFLGMREALSNAVFLLERNDKAGLDYLDVAVTLMINRFGTELAMRMLGLQK